MSNKSNRGPVNMESMGSETPADIKGRVVDPDKEETTEPNKEIVTEDKHMNEILKHVPDAIKERVSKLTRAELAMPGAPRDREAYEAYLGAEKMIRDLKRQEEKRKFNWKGIPKQNG